MAALHGALMLAVWNNHLNSGKSVYFDSWKDIIYIIYAPGFIVGRPLAILFDAGLVSEQSILWVMFTINLAFSFFVGFFIFKIFNKSKPSSTIH